MKALAILAHVLILTPALGFAQVVSPLNAPAVADTTARADAAQAKADAAAAAAAASAACMPASMMPPAEGVTASAGSSGACRRADAVQPRQSRTGACTLNAAGICTGSWDGSAFPAGSNVSYVGDPAPVNTGAAPITCNASSAATVSGFAVRCWTQQGAVLTLGALTAGNIQILPYAATIAGTVVNVTGLTKSTQ